MTPVKVPFNRSVSLPSHAEDLQECISRGHLAGMGPLTRECETLLSGFNGSRNLIVTSATSALEMMALLLEIKPGDEVILPSFTFVSTANAFALRGAELRFADNDALGNILPEEVERLCTPKTRAVIAVHYAGSSADMTRLKAICSSKHVPLVEDAAQAIGSTYRGQALGTFGELGCYSFHETKNVGCGEGGALILPPDSRLNDRAEILREKGTNRRKFVEGLTDKYTWVDLGSSYVLSELNLALLHPQLKAFSEIQSRRKTQWERYRSELEQKVLRSGHEILGFPSWNEPNHHIFGLILKSRGDRSSLIQHMAERSVITPFHYVSLHRSPYGSRYHKGEHARPLPGCERLSDRLVRLPMFYNMSDDEQGYVIECAAQWLARK